MLPIWKEGGKHRIGSKNGSKWALSSARASKIAELFLKSGVSSKLIKASGMGDAKPLFAEQSANGRRLAKNMIKNQRMQIIFRRKNIKDDTFRKKRR